MKQAMILAACMMATMWQPAEALGSKACEGWRDGWNSVYTYSLVPTCPFSWTSEASYEMGFSAGQSAAIRRAGL